jgi:tRNA1(Val) A37 N6-methylase TrmN6
VNGYEPVYLGEMEMMLSSLPVDFPNYTFIDFGSGKGRALLTASIYPFHRITGVEFARELHEVALKNISSYRNPKQKCFDISSVHADATEYDIPPEQVVLFFNNPFRASLMEATVRNIERSLRATPRDAYIIAYGRWTARAVIQQLPGIELAHEARVYSIYHVPQYAS